MVFICISIMSFAALLEVIGLIAIGKRKPPRILYSACLISLIKNELLRKISPDSNRESLNYYEKIYFGEDLELKRVETEGKIISLAIGISFLLAAVFLLGKYNGSFDSRYISKLTRPSKGQAKVKIVAEYDDDEHEIELDISSLGLSEGEKDKEFKKAVDSIEEIILGNNTSLKSVTKPLSFQGTIGKAGVKAYYYSSNTKVIDSSGNVYSDSIYEETNVVITVNFSLENRNAEKKLIVVVHPSSDKSKNKNLITDSLEKMLESNEKNFDLPSEVDGKAVRFKTANDDTMLYVTGLGFLVALILVPYGFQKKKEKIIKRNDELVYDYPELVSKLILFLEAGMTIRASFERISLDYEKRNSKKVKAEKRYLYEEMIKTRNEIAVGISENTAYENFGRRCGLIIYLRLARLLSENVRKGGESLIISLKSEMKEAQKEKREAIKKKGEEIRMKLLIPMMGMFALVLAILLIPALMSL